MLSNGHVRFGERAEETHRLERSVARLGPTPRRALPLQAGRARGQGTARRAGWRPGVWPSTRTRRASSPSSEGFDFLGFNVRRYGTKPLIKPSKAAVRRIRERLRTELRSLRGTNAPAVIKKLNPIIRGWAAYYRTQVSSRDLRRAGSTTCGGSPSSGPGSATRTSRRRWVVGRYFGRFNKARQDRWVFGDRKSGAYMHKFAWTNIVRHQIVDGAASPDDPALADYWAKRRRKTPLPIDKTSRRLIKAQDGRCPICQDALVARR